MVRWKRAWLLAFAAFVIFVLNFTEISYLPLLSKDSPDSVEHGLPSNTQIVSSRLDPKPRVKQSKISTVKPWPSPSSHLPSFFPWFPPQPNLPPRSCEGFFGNGFLRTFDLLNTSGARNFSIISHEENKSKDSGGGDDGVRDRHDDVDDDDDAMRNMHRAQYDVNSDGMQAPIFRCHFSETLRTSICEARNVVMHPERIGMSIGGEPIGSVLGRTDEEELPSFSPGAFELIISNPPRKVGIWTSSDTPNRIRIPDFANDAKIVDSILPQGQIFDHRLRSLIASFRTVKSSSIRCSKVRESTLLVIRYEYANLFHTTTDWYSSYVASRVLDLEDVPNVVFVDGHCESPMDDGWKALFSDVKYAKHFDAPVCFDHVVFTPLGYETAIFKGLNSGIPCKGCPAEELREKKDTTKETARLQEFGEFFKHSFGISNSNPVNVLKILLIRREDYLAHPRHGGKPEVRLQNEQEIFNEMTKWAKVRSDEHTMIEIINGTFAHMEMKDQVQAVHDASVIVGVHGAGLTHILFARPGTVVLELLSPLFMRPHYAHISQWMGLEYRSITMQWRVADAGKVLDSLSSILDKLMQQYSLSV